MSQLIFSIAFSNSYLYLCWPNLCNYNVTFLIFSLLILLTLFVIMWSVKVFFATFGCARILQPKFPPVAAFCVGGMLEFGNPQSNTPLASYFLLKDNFSRFDMLIFSSVVFLTKKFFLFPPEFDPWNFSNFICCDFLGPLFFLILKGCFGLMSFVFSFSGLLWSNDLLILSIVSLYGDVDVRFPGWPDIFSLNLPHSVSL